MTGGPWRDPKSREAQTEARRLTRKIDVGMNRLAEQISHTQVDTKESGTQVDWQYALTRKHQNRKSEGKDTCYH